MRFHSRIDNSCGIISLSSLLMSLHRVLSLVLIPLRLNSIRVVNLIVVPLSHVVGRAHIILVQDIRVLFKQIPVLFQETYFLFELLVLGNVLLLVVLEVF